MTSRNMTLNDQSSKVKGHLIKMTLTISKSIVPSLKRLPSLVLKLFTINEGNDVTSRKYDLDL